MGGGQLARMMVPAALELGLGLRVLAEAADVSTADAARHSTVGDYRDLAMLRDFARSVDVLTFDHEHVPAAHLETLMAEGVNVQPTPSALRHAQDKLVMRAAIDRLGLPNPAWAAVRSVPEIVEFGETVGWPVVLKTPRGGYDGKGVRILSGPEEATAAAAWFAAMNPLLVEAKVDFSRELSAMVARRPSGEAVAWPVVESIQIDGVCDEVIAPAPQLAADVAAAARDAALRIADELGVTGAMAVEIFETPGIGAGFLINELAMRPHNSGHWSMDGALTGQFEQHLRAVADLPLGDPRPLAPFTVMKNILGGPNQELYRAYPAALAAQPGIKVHNYGKSVRPGRKIAHVNGLARDGESLAALRARVAEAASIIRNGAPGPAAEQPTTNEAATR
ncbi:5-(carboxyamino)imidazole ribonucleotide synthase [Arthrobacter russicus]